MPFTYRMHKAFVNLDSGGSMQFRLPPMTEGPLLIKIRRITVGETDQPGDHSPSGIMPGPLARVGQDRISDLDEMRRSKWIAPGFSASAVLHGTALEDDSGIPDPLGGGSGPAAEITLELMQRDQLIQQRTGGNNLLHHMPVWPGGAGLWLKVSRQADGSSDRRRYMIDAQYPSVLPLVSYRAPLAFWKRGFEENWNKAKYFEMLQVEARVVQYRLDRKLSLLYDLEREKTIPLPLPSVVTSLPTIDARNFKLDAGWAQDPIIPPATTSLKVPYISLRIDFVYPGSRDIVLDHLPDITLPEELWGELRLQLRATSGRLIYVPVLLLPDSIPDKVEVVGIEIELGKKIKDGVERSLYMAQWKDEEEEVKGKLNHFDEYIRPWLVGHYELAEIEYDEATDEMVFWHVGKPIAVPIEMSGGGPIGGSPQGLPDLFATAVDEKWADPPLPGGIIRRPPIVDPGELAKIDHIVVLMQENRSFDQVFGYLSRDGLGDLGIQDVEGLASEGDRDVNEYRFSPIADPVRFRSTLTNDTSWPFEIDNPCHSRDCVSSQMSGGMKSFVANFAQRLGAHATEESLQRIMNYYGSGELPVYAALSREFAICDHWFGSHIGGTLPNRHVMLSGDLNRDRHSLPEEENSDFKGYAPSERLTFFDHLTRNGVSWKIFEHGYSFVRLYRNFAFDKVNIVGFEDPVQGFETMAREGTLPSVSVIEPNYIELPDGNDDHAPADMHNGQRLVARIVRAMMNGPVLSTGFRQWHKSMLIITYDEHGGFYDHLFPPDQVEVRGSDGTVTTRPIPALSNGISRLGPRVPAIIVSPLIPRGEGGVNVSRTVYEHATIPATILRRFCGPRPPIMSGRVSAANDLRDLLRLDQARPDSDYGDLWSTLNDTANSQNRRTEAPFSPVPLRKLTPDADPESFKEDFQGFIAYASALMGRGS
ncbi:MULTISPECIES: alkaline phosphatase family protein [unclassified Sinorhizobium]|uniref:alkaline phosphatase family protein n=1 Tax=unclassified Sinorhizobium TaxID=2613772 RepID=UPI0024C37B77|nr:MULTISPECIES: alkaline phosphatase family protein [unclassified Sinorhizobium]MDK1376793.1 alkaline phosphatase family protein [Sinorhizobium sp. 6-70]MDK1479564.1 alkaline phosphatase family protein [Sinorhizobium sp. 6-117]